MLLPIAPAIDADVSDQPARPLTIRQLARGGAAFGVLAAEFFVLRLHVDAHAHQFVDAFLVGLGITFVVAALSPLPALRWLREPLRPSFESSRIRRRVSGVMLQVLVCVMWITRDLPAIPWLLAMFVVVPFAAEPIVRSIAGLRLRRGTRTAS